jgi:flagellar biosynthesis/type III secretory pathway M-ring protein FliF/YscJ
MQSANEASHFWQWLVSQIPAFAGGATVFGVVFKLILDRRKPAAEIHETEARAKLSEADASNKDADTMAEVFKTLRMAHRSLDLEIKERRELNEKFEQCERECRRLTRENTGLRDENRKFKDNLRLD